MFSNFQWWHTCHFLQQRKRNPGNWGRGHSFVSMKNRLQFLQPTVMFISSVKLFGAGDMISCMTSAKTFLTNFLPFSVGRIIQWFLLVFICKLWTAFWFNLCQTIFIWCETRLCSLVVCSAWASQLAIQILSFPKAFLIAKGNFFRLTRGLKQIHREATEELLLKLSPLI